MWELYRVENKLGFFVGIARSMEKAVEYWGTTSKITPMDEEDVLELRKNGQDRVFIVV